jgi:phage terminase large subunit-like protein
VTGAEWESWPQAQLEELLERLESVAAEQEMGRGPWLCDIPDCDGRPHKGRRIPHSRAEQRAPGDDQWDVWNLLAGRGFGKTRTGAEWVIQQARTQERGALVGPTAADVRDIMVEGESGILACARAAFRPRYEPSKRRLVYPNGATQHCYSADEPDRLRGPQHHYFWADEMAAWRYLQEAWDMLQMGLRLGEHPRGCVTTTPRPLPLIKKLAKDPRVHTVRGSTYDNLHNLAPTFQRAVLDRYEGTTLGRQELHADILEDLPGALIRRADIDAARVDAAPDLDPVVVAVDPAGTGTGDEAGIVVVGRGTADGHAYVLADYSGQMTARATGRRAWAAVEQHGAAFLVYEDNFGKQWLRDGLLDAYADHYGLSATERKRVHDAEEWTAPMRSMATAREIGVRAGNPYKILQKVNAQHGKHLRAQPVAMRYEQGKVHHVGVFPELEDQACTWNPHEDSSSPDRVDALVHGITLLLRREKGAARVASPHAMGLGPAQGVSSLPRIGGAAWIR